MSKDRDRLLHDVLLEGEGERKEALRRDCLSALRRETEKERIRDHALSGLRRKRRHRQILDITLASAALLALAFLFFSMSQESAPPPSVIAATGRSSTSLADHSIERTVPAPELEWIRPIDAIVRAKPYGGIQTIDKDDSRIKVARNRSAYRDELYVRKTRKSIGRMTQLSRFAMARYIRGHAKIDKDSETGLSFNSPHGERVFFEEGVPVHWLISRTKLAPE